MLLDAQASREGARSRRRAERGPRAPAGVPRLVELSVPARSSATANGPRYDVVVGGYRVVVGEDFTEATLARLLRVVSSC